MAYSSSKKQPSPSTTYKSRSPQKPNKKQNKGLYFVLAGSLLIAISVSWKVYRSGILSFDTPDSSQFVAEEVETEKPNPTKISIPKISLDLAITEATITGGTWEISETGASHWDNSADPGEDGNVVIYAHNKKNLFGPIRWLETGETIKVTNEDGEVSTYQIEKTATIEPTELEYVLPKEEETLTLYTCTGFLDSDRFIIVAKPV